MRNTHFICGINRVIKEDSVFSEDETAFLDGFTDKESHCFTSHTGLAYGNVQPTVDDAEKAMKCTKKAQESVKEIRKKVLISRSLSSISV